MSEPPNPYQSPLPPGEPVAPEPTTRPDGTIPFRGTASGNACWDAAGLMRASWHRVVFSIILFVCLVSVFLTFGAPLFDALTGRQLAFQLPPLVAVLCLGVAAIGFHLWFPRYRLAARFRRLGRGPFFHIEGYISPDAVHLRSDGHVTVLPWSVFSARRWNNGVVVLLFNKPSGFGQVFAHSMFETDADWLAFRALVREKLPLR
ncbi:MAG: hypothetical protein JW809_10285 [Pirellulales bacterium]|nr:hypothetical protein [Pirellulales bacterium]